MMIYKNKTSVKYKKWLKRLEPQLHKPTKQNSLTVPKVATATIMRMLYLSNKQPNVPPCLRYATKIRSIKKTYKFIYRVATLQKVICLPFAKCLVYYVLIIIISESSGKLLIVHFWLILSHSPSTGNLKYNFYL